MLKKGFTLVEGLIAVILIALLIFVIGLYIREGVAAWGFLGGQKRLILSQRAAMNRLTKELKRARQNTNILTHTTKEVRFLDIENNLVRFYQSGPNLMRDSEVLFGELQDPCGLSLTYHDSDGNETANPSEMAFIRCRMTSQSGDNRFVLESASRLRVRRIK
ncbi:MAG: hypothetical protein JW782_01700 [Candidatus Saganbacteria bacterium]|nr:hypothetical protein [Candidatus Saganbacteria bacterium]